MELLVEGRGSRGVDVITSAEAVNFGVGIPAGKYGIGHALKDKIETLQPPRVSAICRDTDLLR